MGRNHWTNSPECASWFTVLLAAIPGLLLVFSRVNIIQLAPILQSLVTYGYLAILIVGVPLIWYRQRRFPPWALLPAGLVIWELVYLAGNLLTELLSGLGWLPPQWQDGMLGFAMLEIGLTVVLSVFILRGQRLSASVWLAIGAIVLVNLLATIIYYFELPARAWMNPGIILYLSNAAFGLLDGLLLVAVGMLAVRQHGLMAMLVVIGGFGYMCMDSDFISGFLLNQWGGYPVYSIGMTALYLVVTPIALLRARTRLGRLLGVFIPVGIYLSARIVVPLLVIPYYPHQVPWGDILFSVNIMLNFVLAWVLYSNIETATHGEEIVGAVSNPPQPVLSGNYH